MSAKSTEALVNSILNRWSETSNPAAGSTVAASRAGVANYCHVLDILIASQVNKTSAAITSTLHVRDSSIAGTVLAAIEFLPGAASAERVVERVGIPGLIGNAIHVSFNTVQASVVQAVTITGYSEVSN